MPQDVPLIIDWAELLYGNMPVHYTSSIQQPQRSGVRWNHCWHANDQGMTFSLYHMFPEEAPGIAVLTLHRNVHRCAVRPDPLLASGMSPADRGKPQVTRRSHPSQSA
jgi:hypothetical protein